jgi:hypothetical protein
MMNRTVGKWTLPQPLGLKDENEWLPVPKIARTIPFGYQVDPNDEHVLLPIKNELDLLEKAKDYLKQYSYREVANWLSRNTNRYISHVGLRKRIDDERRRKNKAGIYRRWHNIAKAALAKADELEQKRLNAKANTDESGSGTEAGSA